MLISKYKRVEKPGHKHFATMTFKSGPSVILDFGKDEGKLKFPVDFIADAVEHYLSYLIQLALKGEKYASKKGKLKRNDK